MDGADNTLRILAELAVPHAVNPRLMAYCPTMDLLAVATLENQVHVYRLSGQKVFSVANRQAVGGVNQIQWKPDGQSIAVAFDTRKLCLTSAQTGKIMYQLDCSIYSNAQICCLGWGFNVTGLDFSNLNIQLLGGASDWEGLLNSRSQAKSSNLPDLPTDLAFLDVESVLPKLSTLPSGGQEDDIFSTRASLDTVFRPLTVSSTEYVDVLIVGFEDGTVHLSVYDFFQIGVFHLDQVLPLSANIKALLHCSHPISTTHSLLVSSTSHGRSQLHVIPLDLRLISSNGRYLSLLASKSTQLHNILRYLHQLIRQIQFDFRASQELQSRFIQNIDDTLRDKCDSTWKQEAYQLVVTGYCYPEFKEWLVNELGERGHKRWEKATATGLENVRRLAHENLLPALDRFSVLISRLRGLSKFQDSNLPLGLSTLELDDILDTVNSLQLVSHKILVFSCSKTRQFYAFSSWLRQEIETQATDPASAAAQEAAEKDNNIDYARTLEYIQDETNESRLFRFLGLRDDNDSQQSLDAEGRSIYEFYKKGLSEKNRKTPTPKPLPGLTSLVAHLDKKCSSVFNRIAETQRRNVRLGAPIEIGGDLPFCLDMRMVKEASLNEEFVLYISLVPAEDRRCVKIFRISIKIKNGVSTTQQAECALVQIQNGQMQDVKFMNNENCIVIVMDELSSRLISFDYRPAILSSSGLVYKKMAIGSNNLSRSAESGDDGDLLALDLSVSESPPRSAKYEFPDGPSWTPEKLVINNREDRRLACVLVQDKMHLRHYDLNNMGMAKAKDSQFDATGDVEMTAS